MRPEVIFSYNNTRCHAKKVEALLGDERYTGETGGFFDQSGFVAVSKEEEQ